MLHVFYESNDIKHKLHISSVLLNTPLKKSVNKKKTNQNYSN